MAGGKDGRSFATCDFPTGGSEERGEYRGHGYRSRPRIRVTAEGKTGWLPSG